MQRLPALLLSGLECSTPTRRLLVPALALLALAASAGGAAAAGTELPPWPRGTLSASGSAQVSGPGAASSDYDVSLIYTVTDDGAGVVHDIALSGQLTNTSTGDEDAFACTPQHTHPWLPEPGPAGLLWLVPNASVSCSASLTLPPGDYTATLTATGRDGGIWYFPLVSGYLPPWQDDFSGDHPACRVLAQAQVPLDPAAPPPAPPPSTPPPPPPPAPAVVPSTPPPRHAAVITPPPPPPAPPSSPPPSTPPPPPPAPSASPSLLFVAQVAAAQPPSAPQIPTPLFVLIMVLPAVAAGAALLGRGR